MSIKGHGCVWQSLLGVTDQHRLQQFRMGSLESGVSLWAELGVSECCKRPPGLGLPNHVLVTASVILTTQKGQKALKL